MNYIELNTKLTGSAGLLIALVMTNDIKMDIFRATTQYLSEML
jgi:hypothetical protein